MDQLQDCMKAYLDRIGCRYRRSETENLYTFALQGRKGVYPMLLYAKAPFLICIARLPLYIPDARRLEVAEYLHRVNFGLLLGNFEMDYDEGEVRFRTTLAADERVGDAILDRYIQMPAAMLDQYAAGLYAIVFDGEIASAALEDTETEES